MSNNNNDNNNNNNNNNKTTTTTTTKNPNPHNNKYQCHNYGSKLNEHTVYQLLPPSCSTRTIQATEMPHFAVKLTSKLLKITDVLFLMQKTGTISYLDNSNKIL